MTRRAALAVAGVLAVIAVATGVAFFGPWHDRGQASSRRSPADPTATTASPPTKSPQTVAEEYAAAWQAGDLSGIDFTDDATNVGALVDLTVAGLTPGDDDHPSEVDITAVTDGPTDQATATARAKAHVTWRLDDTRTWDYDVDIALARATAAGAARWQVDWEPSALEPSLRPGEVLRTTRSTAARGDILGLDGQPLVGRRDLVEVGSKDFARGLLGTAGEATREDIEASEGQVQAGDVIGRSGLQAAQDEVLGGTPGLSVEAIPVGGEAPRMLKSFPAVPGRPVTVTLDPRVQRVADAVMARAPKPAALVAIRVSNGDVLAVANGPSGSSAYNRAMVGRYPPGSTFKVTSGFTLLQQGLTLDTPVACPASITVGKVFKNAGGEVLGTVPFRRDFADSCNTAFVGLSGLITAQQLHDTAAQVGYRDLDVGTPVFGGSVPVTDDATEHAANMIGQGKVLSSPFAVALASASVAAGRSVQPRLVVDPAAPPPAPGPELAPLAAAQAREAMRLVVTEGTGKAVAGVPGGDVFAKTGTAEFGTASPPRTHAWFTGFQGDVAFAVLVEDGGFGGAVAAPLAAEFLTRLA